jgi:hypothetical protein
MDNAEKEGHVAISLERHGDDSMNQSYNQGLSFRVKEQSGILEKDRNQLLNVSRLLQNEAPKALTV